MSGSIDAINGNGMSLQFEEFARIAQSSSKKTNVVRFLGSSDAATVHEVSVTKSDKVGKLFRSGGVKTANDTTRAIFRQSVASMFGGEDHIPENVRKAMKLNDYGKGKPLTAKRILAVKVAVEAALAFPGDGPRISAPAAHVRPTWPEDGLVSVKDVTDMGYAPAELKKLANVVDLYREATNCTLDEAQQAALDPKSTVRRLYSYGGTFTANAENFAKGLALMDSFSSWYDDFIQTPENTGARAALTPDAKLAAEKFLFEELGCNPKLMSKPDDPESVFGPKNNPVMRFMLDNMMQALSGSFAGISPEKRSVVYAMADALRENDAASGKARPFYYQSTLLARTLANFGKAAELVYSGNLNRTTAFNTLFPDFKKFGLSGSSTNLEISEVIGDELQLAAENRAAMDSDDRQLQLEVSRKTYMFQEMFNTADASIQECKRAALSGKRLDSVPGISNVTSDLQDASGFTDAGRKQFVSDMHRPAMPQNTRTKQPALTAENNVFRFNIGGQEFTAETSFQKTNEQKQLVTRHNEAIAEAVENFCCKNVHPIQANAVLFAMSQGGLMPQLSLMSHGYGAGDHGPITYTLTKDAETGSVNIKYANPEGSPLKFSWTVTVDVEGKVTSTPVQIEE